MERQIDPQLNHLLRAELKRQRETLSLIPSENIASPAVLRAMSSILTNKYSEGYPGHRFYGGNKIADQVETLAINRVKKLFGADHANVQPHAGAIANLAVYNAVLKPGDKILAMDLRAGGHLTHGYRLNISGQLYRSFFYGLDANGWLDYRQLKELAIKHRPKIIISGASAYPREIDFARIGKIAKSVNALHLADIAHLAGLVAANLHPSPIPHADFVTFTTHKTLRGPRGAVILCRTEFANAIDRAVMPGIQGGPLDHIIAAKAQAFAEAATHEFRRYQQATVRNAEVMAETLSAHGVSLVSGGTDNHLILADVTPLGMSGSQAEKLLEAVGIIINKNLIANDPRSPLDPSGIRLGTPSITSRGLKEKDVIDLTHIIIQRLSHPNRAAIKKLAVTTVRRLTRRYPLYPGLTL